MKSGSAALLLDTGVLVAMLDKDDPHHAAARELLEKEKGPLIVPAAVLPEVCYLAHKYLGPAAEHAFVASLADEELPVDWGGPEDIKRAAQIMKERPDLGLVDALVIAAAERLNVCRIAVVKNNNIDAVVLSASGFPFRIRPRKGKRTKQKQLNT